MARPPHHTFPEASTFQVFPFVGGANGADVETEDGERLEPKERTEMSGPSGSGGKPRDRGNNWPFSGASSSFKYSHEDTRPEKIYAKMEDLQNDMQDTMRRLDNLEAKLRNGTSDGRKEPESNSATRDRELGNALNRIMKDLGHDASNK